MTVKLDEMTQGDIYHGSVVPAVVICRRLKRAIKIKCCPSVKWALMGVQYSVWVCLMCQVSLKSILSVSPCYYRRRYQWISHLHNEELSLLSTVIALRAICFTTKNLCIFLTECIDEILMNLRSNSDCSEQSPDLYM